MGKAPKAGWVLRPESAATAAATAEALLARARGHAALPRQNFHHVRVRRGEGLIEGGDPTALTAGQGGQPSVGDLPMPDDGDRIDFQIRKAPVPKHVGRVRGNRLERGPSRGRGGVWAELEMQPQQRALGHGAGGKRGLLGVKPAQGPGVVDVTREGQGGQHAAVE